MRQGAGTSRQDHLKAASDSVRSFLLLLPTHPRIDVVTASIPALGRTGVGRMTGLRLTPASSAFWTVSSAVALLTLAHANDSFADADCSRASRVLRRARANASSISFQARSKPPRISSAAGAPDFRRSR